MKIINLLFLLLLVTGLLSAQSEADKEKALELGRSAITKMDNGEIQESLDLLEQAAKLDPDNNIFPYETAYAHYLGKEYKMAVKVLKKLAKKPEASKQVFNLLGNAYDMAGDQKKAEKSYQAGIKAYPGAANYYVELGILEGRRGNWDQAAAYWEQGIMTDPNYPSNYYHLANLFAKTKDHIWTILFGEIFMNLERSTARTEAMSETIYLAYRKAIELKGDSAEVNFARNMTMILGDLEQLKLPAPMIFGTTMALATTDVIGETEVNSTTLNTMRESFLQYWADNKQSETYPNVLIDFQQEIKAEGLLEAYNHWVFSQGDPVGWEFWVDAHETEFNEFVEWFTDNKLQIPKDKVLTRESF